MKLELKKLPPDSNEVSMYVVYKDGSVSRAFPFGLVTSEEDALNKAKDWYEVVKSGKDNNTTEIILSEEI